MNAMQLEVKIDSAYSEPKVILLTASMTEEVDTIINQLTMQMQPNNIISGCRVGDNVLEVIEQADLIRIYANAGKVFAVTQKGEYVLRHRLYEIEALLPSYPFVRISNSEIVNLKHVDHFDLRFTGTICVKFTNGYVTYVSRRYVSKLKKLLGI